jgi:hypothetical protein
MRFQEPDHEERIHSTDIASDETLTEALVRALTTITGRSQEDLKPLQAVIDMDDLERLHQSAKRAPTAPIKITFSYENYEIALNRSEIRMKERPERRNQ